MKRMGWGILLGFGLVLAAAILCIGFCGGFSCGRQHVKLTEFRINYVNLRTEASPGSALHEYWKARYYLLAGGLSDKEILGNLVDFGPVNTGLLAGVCVDKDAISLIALDQCYAEFVERRIRLAQRD